MGVECVSVSSGVGASSFYFCLDRLKTGFSHTHTQTNTPKPNFIRVPNMASRSEDMINKVRSCDLVRFIRGFSLRVGFSREKFFQFCSKYISTDALGDDFPVLVDQKIVGNTSDAVDQGRTIFIAQVITHVGPR